jgi:uncharacterized spore protein YtfJ
MGSLALLQSLKESVTSQASVKTLYGEPISAHEKTIIPVAKIMFAYGAGAGSGGVGENSTKGEGGGGGGGVRAIPVGVIEVSTGQTRFVPITSRKKLVAASLGGIVVGALIGWLRRRQ